MFLNVAQNLLIQSFTMLKSMTAYGRSCVIFPLGRFSVEIQSVNRKHLEINTSLPNEFLRFDADLKKWISEVVGRGQVNVKVRVFFEKESPLTVVPNVALATQIQKAWKELAASLKIAIEEKGLLDVLSRTENILLYSEELQDEQEYKKALKGSVEQALMQLLEMKNKEGQVLYEDISARLHTLQLLIKHIAVKAPGATLKYREKLLERLKEVLGASIENEERVLREVCVYADKIDIVEELTRFNSHLQQARHLLDSKEQAIGKNLEFLLQELNREVNTIGSKSSDVDIARCVIEIKTELERIREQIQNIE